MQEFVAMAIANDPRYGIGGNAPNDYEAIKARIDELLPVAEKWAAERPEITDDETATKCDAFLGQIEAELKAAEKARVDEKEPHLSAGRAVDTKYKPLAMTLEAAKALLKPRLAKYLKGKQAKLDHERMEAQIAAERLAEDAAIAAREAEKGASIAAVIAAQELAAQAEQAAAVVEATPTRAAVKSAYSSRARSLRTVWKAQVTNISAAMLNYRAHPEMTELLERLASAEARSGVRTLPGFKIFPEES